MNANEQFIVKHYSEDERPILKGHGFDGLTIGDDRQEAQEFVDYLNTMLRQQQAEIEMLKANREHDFGLGEASGFIKGHQANPYKAITNTKIEPTVVSYTHPVKEHFEDEPQAEELHEILQSNAELTDEEIADFLYAYCLDMGDVYEVSEEQFIKCVRAILRKAQKK